MALNKNDVQYEDEELEDVMVKTVAVPDCATCIYSNGPLCKKFGVNKNEVPVDIFNCPDYVSEKEKASKVLGVDLNGN